MPYEIKFNRPPAGYAASAGRAGEKIEVQVLEFTSTEDGQHFIQRLEGIPHQIVTLLAGKCDMSPSQIDHLLAVIRRDGQATIYINELPIQVKARAGRSLEKGELVFKDDILDIDRVNLGNLKIGANCGILFLFSVGWRKGLYYDLGPIQSKPAERNYDLEAILGQFYGHVLFQEKFSLTDNDWQALFKCQWFLFNGLRNSTNEHLISHLREGWGDESLIATIAEELKGRVPSLLDSWSRHSTFAPHHQILSKAVERFQAEDYVSCSGLLFPRIEGIMRTNANQMNAAGYGQNALADAAVSTRVDNPRCLLLPHRFNAYLKQVYFANFSPNDPNIEISRHSVSHGVAPQSQFNAKAAAIGILVVHQLYLCCETEVEVSSNSRP